MFAYNRVQNPSHLRNLRCDRHAHRKWRLPAIILVVFQQFHKEECTLEIDRAKTEILVITTKCLIIQINVE